MYHCGMARDGGTPGAEQVGQQSGVPGGEEALALGPQPLPELIEYRNIEDPVVMKAVADPLRLKILRVMSRDARVAPRIVTVKQLAEELGEPPTKLYRHIKQLLAVGMIQVAELRLVGGIVEQSYRVAQVAWGVNMGSVGGEDGQPPSEEVLGLLGAALDEYVARYERALRTGRTFLRNEDNLANPPHVRSVGAVSDFRVPQEYAAEFAERLQAMVKEFNDTKRSDSPDAVYANLLMMFYATVPDDED